MIDPSTISIPPELWTFTGAGIAGFAIGKFLKLAAKFVAILAGGLLLILGFLDYKGIIAINYSRLQSQIQTQAQNLYNQISAVVEHMAHQFNQSAGTHVIAGSVGFIGGIIISART